MAGKVQAFCHVCLGGGKLLGRPSGKRDAEREATSHMGQYGHQVSIVPARKNPMSVRDKLVSLLTQLDAKQAQQEMRAGRRVNIYRIGIYLEAANDFDALMRKGKAAEAAYAEVFTPSRPMHGIAKKLGLALDVDRGQWVVVSR